jgi:hypothetical protein
MMLFVPLLVVRLAQEVGGFLVWGTGILEMAHDSIGAGGAGRAGGTSGRVPGGAGALVLLAGLALAVVSLAVQSLIYIAASALLAPLVAFVQAILLGVGLRALLDLFQVRGGVPLDDPRYLQRWRARGIQSDFFPRSGLVQHVFCAIRRRSAQRRPARDG